jgi:hypothetical protein
LTGDGPARYAAHMTHRYYATAAGLLAASVAVAQLPPLSLPTPKPAHPPAVLLLADYRTVEGALVDRANGEYHLKRGDAVVKVAEKDVLFAGGSRDEVFRFMANRPKPDAPAIAVDPPGQATNGEAMKGFPGLVQPVLMNACVNCHGKPDYAGAFKLVRVPPGYTNPEAALRNARAAAAVVNRDDPSNSLLVAKAIAPHGGRKDAPFPTRGHPAVQTLERWAHWAAGPEGSPMPAVIPGPKVVVKAVAATVPATPPKEPAKLPASVEKASVPAKPNPADPYDPGEFNRLPNPGG